MEDSNSGDGTYHREDVVNQSPESQSTPAPESPASPGSLSSPREQDAPSSPSSPVEQSEHEASDVEMSDAEEADNKENDDEENAEKSDDERSHSEAEDSDREEDTDGFSFTDSDAESEISEIGGLITEIFGESEEEEFEGFKEEDIAAGKSGKAEIKPKEAKRKRAAISSDSEDEKEEEPEREENADEKEGVTEDVPAPPDNDLDGEDDGKIRADRGDFVYDFDLMMQKKKEERSKRRKRRHVDLINDSDDLIADIIAQMRMAAEEDKELNKVKRIATKKLKILPMVLSQLKKQDLKMAFLEQGVLNVIAEWISPLPDRSLPHLNIREGMLKQLSDYPNFDPSLLKSSGIGRALMYLYKHPKETKENRERAGKLITEWARPIFNVTINYHALTKEERKQRDYDHIPKRRRKDQGTSEAEEPEVERRYIEKEITGESTAIRIRPGDKGWVGRARVPLPSTKDYVNRPKWNVEMELRRGPSKKPLTRIEKHMRSIQDKKRLNKQQRAITISIEGRRLAI